MAGEIYANLVSKGGPQNALSQHLNFKKAFMDAQRLMQYEMMKDKRKEFIDIQQKELDRQNTLRAATIGQGEYNPAWLDNPASMAGGTPQPTPSSSTIPMPTSEAMKDPRAAMSLASGGVGDLYGNQLMSQKPQQPQGQDTSMGQDTSLPKGWTISPKLAEAKATKISAQQDKLENQAMQRMVSIRGDTSIGKVEQQRDASITAYNLLAEIKKENRFPNQVEYFDLLGQLWRARTGVAPTDQVIGHLDQKTGYGNWKQFVQFWTGKSTGITTISVADSLIDFSKKSGQQADKLHTGYMKTRMIKPSGLNEDKWQEILKTGRGLSFEEATSQGSQTSGQGGGQQLNSQPTPEQIRQARQQGYTGWDSSTGQFVR